MNIIQASNINIFEFQSDLSLVDEVYEQILNSDISYLSSVNSHSAELSGYGKTGYVETDKGLSCFYNQKLYDWFNGCIQEVSSLYFVVGGLEISDLWVYKQEQGEAAKGHVHYMSIFSAVYYITENTGSHTIFEFDDPVFKYFYPFYGNIVKPKPFSYTSKPKKGKLLLWPSFIKHKTQTQADVNTRYTISFNTMLTGNIGNAPTQFNHVSVASPAQHTIFLPNRAAAKSLKNKNSPGL